MSHRCTLTGSLSPSLRRLDHSHLPNPTPAERSERRVAQRFFQFGARFSAKARGPSVASSLLKTSPEISDSIR